MLGIVLFIWMIYIVGILPYKSYHELASDMIPPRLFIDAEKTTVDNFGATFYVHNEPIRVRRILFLRDKEFLREMIIMKLED